LCGKQRGVTALIVLLKCFIQQTNAQVIVLKVILKFTLKEF